MTPVDSWPPTPSLSPRKTIVAAITHVADERDHEDLVVEDAVEVGAQATEDGVERRDDGDRQVRLEAGGTSGLEHQAEDDADDQAEAAITEWSS
jgi:hypothetical protein